MKLTKRLLAVVLAVAMLFGMVAVGATASITDYFEYDPVDNPYTAKIGLKTYIVNTEDGTYTEITDGAVNPGDVVRVEIWAQTNYFTRVGSYAFMYQNNIFQPTTLDYTTYDYMDCGTVTFKNVISFMPLDEDHSLSADGTLDNPFYINECLMMATAGFAGRKSTANYAGVKACMPTAWKGTGTAVGNYYSDDQALEYNYYFSGYMQDTSQSLPGTGLCIILTEYQPVLYFNLTVPADAVDGTTGTISIDEGTVASTTNTAGKTYMNRTYSSDGSEEADAADNGYQFITSTSATPYKDTYGEDTTVYNRVVDLSDAKVTLTVGGAGTVDPEPPVETVDKTALEAAITAAKAADTTNCTSASVEALNAAITAAEAVYADDAATQDAVDEQVTLLEAAVAGLAKLGACDYTALDAAIAAYDALDLSAYTPASVAASDVEALAAAAKAIERDMIADEAGANQAAITAAATALDEAIKALVEKANKDALNAAIATVVNKTDYTTDSIEAYDKALEDAKAVAADDNAAQADVDAATAALNTAIAGLAKLGACDYTALDAAIAAYDALDLSAYTPASVAASDVEALAAAAKAIERDMIADEAGANQATITATAAALDEAIKALVEKADKTALNAAIATVVDTTDCTSDSIAAYEKALEDAQAVAADDNAAQADVDAATAALNAAIAGLKGLGTCDYTALDEAKAAYAALVKDDYKPASWTASGVDAAYEAANAIAADLVADEAGANQAAINAAADALTDAIAKLEKKADKTALAAAIATANGYAEADYTPDSWAAADLTATIAAAELVFADADASDDDVTAAIASLEAAAAKLVVKADKEALAAAIAAAQAYEEANYTPASWTDAALAATIEAAQAVYADDNATADAVADAIASLNAAAAKLVEKADKTALNAAIATVVDTTDCTADSIAAYDKALEDAQAVAADDNAAQADVDAATSALNTAIAGLAKLGACDYTALDAAIARYDALDLSAYTPASVAASDVEALAAAAKAVERDMIADEAGANQAAITAAAEALVKAVSMLVEKADKTDLDAAITAAKALVEADYTPESWAAADLATVIAAAEVVLADDNATADAVAAEVANIAAATAKLAGLANKDALKAAIDTLPAVSKDNATADSWAAYEAALAAAVEVYEDANATQAAVDAAEANLLAAVAAVAAAPCDYTALDAAIADYDALVLADYVDTAAATAAYDEAKAIARDLTMDEAGANQAAIAAAAAKLAEAIDALVKKADKTALVAAIAVVPAYDEETATDATWAAYTEALEAAKAVNEDVAATQAAVDEATAALVAATAALASRELCNYTALEAALALVPAEEQSKYTTASWKAYAAAKAAAEAVAKDLVNDKSGVNQKTIDDAAAALEAAYAALEISQAAITNLEVDLSEYYAKETREYTFTVTGAPSKIQIVGKNGSTATFHRAHRNVTIVSYNAAGEVIDYLDEEPAYEKWTIAIALGEGTFQAKAKFGNVWEGFSYQFTVEITDPAEDEVKFVAKAPNGEFGKALVINKGETATIEVVAPDSVVKVQLVFASGGTATYTTSQATVVDNGDGTCTWTINRVFKSVGTGTMTLKLKDYSWYVANTEIITTQVIG